MDSARSSFLILPFNSICAWKWRKPTWPGQWFGNETNVPWYLSLSADRTKWGAANDTMFRELVWREVERYLDGYKSKEQVHLHAVQWSFLGCCLCQMTWMNRMWFTDSWESLTLIWSHSYTWLWARIEECLCHLSTRTCFCTFVNLKRGTVFHIKTIYHQATNAGSLCWWDITTRNKYVYISRRSIAVETLHCSWGRKVCFSTAKRGNNHSIREDCSHGLQATKQLGHMSEPTVCFISMLTKFV